MDTTNLRQIAGGTVIKQADRSSTMSFILQDAIGREVDLEGQTAQVALYTLKGKYWETTSQVKGSIVSFTLPGNLAVDDYLLDVSVAGYVFPSDRDLIIRVTQGFKNLPDKETAERSKRTLEEITADVQKQANEKLEEISSDIINTKNIFIAYVNGKTKEVSTTGDKYLKDIEATTSQNISDIKLVSKTESDKITASSTEAISLIGSKKDQALKDIDSKAKTIADTVKADVASLLKDKVDKEVGKGLSDNNFTTEYKNKLDALDKNLDLNADKKDVKNHVQEVKDLIFDSTVKYQENTIYTLDTVLEDGEVKVKPKEIGKLAANDFLRVQVDSDLYKFRIKSTSKGVILFYSITDEALRYAIHVYPHIKDYEINFGKKVTGEMIFSTVSIPEDKVSIIREEGL